MKIYTKTGDTGKTSLFDGTRVSKGDIRVDTYGSIDELNSMLGICYTHVIAEYRFKKISLLLQFIQNDLFEIGSLLANPRDPVSEFASNTMRKRILVFEQTIDDLSQQMPELTKFIIPGGCIESATLQYARAVSRRVERKIIVLSIKEFVHPTIIIYFNRLSDLLFTMARYCNQLRSVQELYWKRELT